MCVADLEKCPSFQAASASRSPSRTEEEKDFSKVTESSASKRDSFPSTRLARFVPKPSNGPLSVQETQGRNCCQRSALGHESRSALNTCSAVDGECCSTVQF